MLAEAVIIFPHLGITINNLISGFYIGNYWIAFYGILIAIGMVMAVVISSIRAKKTNQYADDYVDIGIISIIAAIIGARIYYVIFSLDEFDNFWQMLDIHSGGLAIYGGVIAGVAATFFVCKYKKISFLRVLDTAAPGIVLAQAIGRWGNFFNREAYGGYTDSLFAMQIKYSFANGVITEDIQNNLAIVDGTRYIQVHPTFLYESVGCLIIFILIMLFSKKQRYNGEVMLWYVGGYALIRAFIEGLRTDQLLLGETPVSQFLSILLLAGSFTLLLINRARLISKNWTPEFSYVLKDGEQGTKAYRDAIKKARKEARKSSGNKDGKDASGGWEITEVKAGEDKASEKQASDETQEELPAEETTAEEETTKETPEEEVSEDK